MNLSPLMSNYPSPLFSSGGVLLQVRHAYSLKLNLIEEFDRLVVFLSQTPSVSQALALRVALHT